MLSRNFVSLLSPDTGFHKNKRTAYSKSKYSVRPLPRSPGIPFITSAYPSPASKFFFLSNGQHLRLKACPRATRTPCLHSKQFPPGSLSAVGPLLRCHPSSPQPMTACSRNTKVQLLCFNSGHSVRYNLPSGVPHRIRLSETSPEMAPWSISHPSQPGFPHSLAGFSWEHLLNKS